MIVTWNCWCVANTLHLSTYFLTYNYVAQNPKLWWVIWVNHDCPTVMEHKTEVDCLGPHYNNSFLLNFMFTILIYLKKKNLQNIKTRQSPCNEVTLSWFVETRTERLLIQRDLPKQVRYGPESGCHQLFLMLELYLWFSMCGPQTSSISIALKHMRKANLPLQSQTN